MELVECQTCGSHSFINGKCDYCGNQYETGPILEKLPEQEEQEITFQETPAGKIILKIMIYTLVSIIWFAVTVFIPPLFIITIILLVVYGIFHLTNRNK